MDEKEIKERINILYSELENEKQYEEKMIIQIEIDALWEMIDED